MTSILKKRNAFARRKLSFSKIHVFSNFQALMEPWGEFAEIDIEHFLSCVVGKPIAIPLHHRICNIKYYVLKLTCTKSETGDYRPYA